MKRLWYFWSLWNEIYSTKAMVKALRMNVSNCNITVKSLFFNVLINFRMERNKFSTWFLKTIMFCFNKEVKVSNICLNNHSLLILQSRIETSLFSTWFWFFNTVIEWKKHCLVYHQKIKLLLIFCLKLSFFMINRLVRVS